MKLVVCQIVDHCQGADIVTYGLRLDHWSAYGPTQEVAQRAADAINVILQEAPELARQVLERVR